jgi:hypothetical protein
LRGKELWYLDSNIVTPQYYLSYNCIDGYNGTNICATIDYTTRLEFDFFPIVDLRVIYNGVISDDPILVNSGDNITLSWTSLNADSCFASGDWSGSKSILPTSEPINNITGESPKIYIITCTSLSGDTDIDSVVVNIQENSKPTVTIDLPVPNPCVNVGEGKISISWTYHDDDGDAQSESMVQISTDSGFPDDERTKQCNYPVSNGNTSQFITKITPLAGCPTQISYDQIYYWRVRVKDGTDWSDWVDGITLDNTYVPVQPYPYVDFSCSPTSVTKKRDVTFIDASKCYSGGGMVPCNLIEDDQIIYTWNFGADAMSYPDYCSSINAKIPPITCQYDFVANEARNEIIQLTISDHGNSCPSSTRMVQVSGNPFKPPTWIEIAPF